MRNKILITVAALSVAIGVSAIAGGPPAPGTWYRSGSITLGQGLHFTDILAAQTALAGGAQATTATTLSQVTEYTTVTSNNDSVTLPAPVAPYGRTRFISNSAASNAIKIFVITPGTVNGITTATGYSLAAGKTALCIELTATNWGCVGP